MGSQFVSMNVYRDSGSAYAFLCRTVFIRQFCLAYSASPYTKAFLKIEIHDSRSLPIVQFQVPIAKFSFPIAEIFFPYADLVYLPDKFYIRGSSSYSIFSNKRLVTEKQSILLCLCICTVFLRDSEPLYYPCMSLPSVQSPRSAISQYASRFCLTIFSLFRTTQFKIYHWIRVWSFVFIDPFGRT